MSGFTVADVPTLTDCAGLQHPVALALGFLFGQKKPTPLDITRRALVPKNTEMQEDVNASTHTDSFSYL